LLVPLLIAYGCDFSTDVHTKDRPNIILIVADDMGWRDSRVYASRFYETPSIDRLAHSGMRFLDAYSASPLCSPTRASIITGLDPGRLRLTAPLGHLADVVVDPQMPDSAPPEERAIAAASRTRLPLEYRTIAEAFKEAGYATALFGKWHLGSDQYLPQNQGFDHAMPGGSIASPPRYLAPYEIPGFADGPPGEHIDQRLATEAVQFIREHRNEPFFVYFSPFSVHAPYMARKQLIRRFEAKVDRRDPQRNPRMAAMLWSLDVSVGIITAAVEKFGLQSDTLIVFTSDNGGVDWNFNPSSPHPTPTDNHPLRGGKGQVYEGGIRVPLIISWPGRIESGTVSREIVSSTDLYPTLLDAAGLSPKPHQQLDGISVLPALHQLPLSRQTVFFHFPHYMPVDLSPPATAVRRGAWKLIRFYADTDDQQDRLELYNLEEDIEEANEVAEQYPDVVTELNGIIDQYLDATSALIPMPNPNYEPGSSIELE
jgi:arylsulfatase A-like enzyme